MADVKIARLRTDSGGFLLQAFMQRGERMSPDRRQFLILAGTALAAPGWAAATAPLDLGRAVAAAEKATGGRVGLSVHDTASGRRFSHRGEERFPMASTFKVLLVAAVLARADTGKEQLTRAVPVRQADILPVSPVSKRHVGGTATVAQLCEGTMIYSDNAAANLLLPSVGGPAGLTAWLRGLGDKVTRLDRIEPMMSEAIPGDPRDTSSPNAFAASFERILLGNILSAESRQQLTRWLVANTTGDTRLRAGLLKGWKVGDKTGTGSNGSVNDVAIIWPAAQARPLIVASFIAGGTAGSDVLYAAHAGLARAIAAAL
jgi:beta-lactamase class A